MKVPAPPPTDSRQDLGLRPADLHPDLGRLDAVKTLLHQSGLLIDVNQAFMVRYSINLGLYHSGYDVSDKLRIFQGYAYLSPHKGRIRETNIVQLLMPQQINVIPNVGSLGEREEEKQGLLSKLWGFVTGRGKEKENK